VADLFDALQRQMLEAVDAAVLGLDAEGVCRYANAAALHLLGADTAGDPVGRTIGDIVHWAARGDLPPWPDALARAATVGTLRSGLESIARADEAPLSVEITLRALFDAGQLAGHLVILHDITDRSRQAKAFHASVRSFRALFDSVGDAVLFLSRQGRIIDSNAGVQRIYGISQQALTGKSIDNILAPGRHAPGHLAVLVERTHAGGAQRAEFWSRAREHGEFQAEIYLYPADYFGQRVVMAMVHDISERKRYENGIVEARDLAEQASRMKSEFMRNVSHELRTPLNGIIGMADLLAEAPDADEAAECLDTIRESGHTLLGIVNNLIDLARLEADQYQTVENEFFLPDLLEGLRARFAPACADKGLGFELVADAALESFFIGDDSVLARILGNLLDNAVKFTASGQVTLCATPVSGVPDGQGDDALRVRFAVRDTGIGIPPERRARIFDAFVQGDGSATRAHGGVGLGLSIARYLVASLGGTLELDSTPGAGSEFAFSVVLRIES